MTPPLRLIDFEKFFDLTPDLLIISGMDGIFKEVNSAALKLLGYSSEELCSKKFLDYVHPEDIASTEKAFETLLSGGLVGNFENRYICKDGSVKILNWSCSPDVEDQLIYCCARDVTEIRKNESETAQILNAFNKTPIVAITNKAGKILSVNENFCKISGYSEDELIGQNHRILNSGVHSKEFFNQLWQTISSGKIWSGEIQNKTKDGKFYFVQTLIAPILDIEGKIDRYLSIRFDVTHEKESERRLEEAQRVAKIGSWDFDVETGKIQWSKQLFEFYGEDPTKEVPTFEQHISSVFPDDRALFVNLVQKCLQNGLPYKFRYRMADFQKRQLWLEGVGNAIKNDQGKVVRLYGTSQDITELVKTEEESKLSRAKVLHNAKLASLGEMSAGIAHEMNNPLAIISGTSALLSKIMNDPEKLKSKIETIQKASNRLSKIISGLMKFARSDSKNPQKTFSLNIIMKEAIVLTEAKIQKYSVSVEADYVTESNILCDEVEIEQVLINLIINAVDAIKTNSEKWIKLKLFEEGESVVLQIRDSGKGIPPEVAKNIFQPFYTTKPVGEGTGLGLSIVKGIMDEHQATIEVLENDPNTCFEIRFKKERV